MYSTADAKKIKLKETGARTNARHLFSDLSAKLTPTEAEILFNEGMTQAKVSAILKVPVKVEVIAQHEISGVIVRQVKIYAERPKNRHVTVYYAESVIPIGKNSNRFISIIRGKGMGIGQAINAMHTVQKRRIIDIYADETVISRNYSITGKGLFVLITEVFLKHAFKGR